MPTFGDLFDFSADPTEQQADRAARRIVDLLRAADGPHWNRGSEPAEVEWWEDGWVLRVGGRRCTLDREGFVHEVSRNRLRVIDDRGVVVVDVERDPLVAADGR